MMDLQKNYTVLAITAECGEPQLGLLIESLKSQKHVSITQRIISYKPALEAERLIYEYALEAKKQGGYDWIIRLDADMLPVSDYSVVNLIKNAELYPDIYKLSTPVQDYFTGNLISGVHLFKPEGVPDIRQTKKSYPEYWITTIKGKSFYQINNPQILHAYNSDARQAIRFGLHRGIKAISKGSKDDMWITILALRANHRRHKNDKYITAAYLASLIGLGLFSEFDTQWEMVDYDSNLNKAITAFIEEHIENLPELIRTRKIPGSVFMIHYRKYKSLYHTFYTVLKWYYVKIISFESYYKRLPVSVNDH
jgi:hypothetical protein